MILVSFSLQRDAPQGAPIGCSPRTSEGFEKAFRGSIKKPCLPDFLSCVSTQYAMLLYHFPDHWPDWIHLTLKSRRPAPEQGCWRSRGDAPSGSGAQPPSRVAGGVTETRRVVAAPSLEQGRWWSRGGTPSGCHSQPLSRVVGGVAETR